MRQLETESLHSKYNTYLKRSLSFQVTNIALKSIYGAYTHPPTSQSSPLGPNISIAHLYRLSHNGGEMRGVKINRPRESTGKTREIWRLRKYRCECARAMCWLKARWLFINFNFLYSIFNFRILINSKIAFRTHWGLGMYGVQFGRVNKARPSGAR